MHFSKLKFLLSLIVCLFLSSSAFALQSGVSDGLIAYYPFSGNANDESGNGLNGTVHGASLTDDCLGNINSAYYFDGVNNNIIELPSSSIKTLLNGLTA